MRLLIHLHSTQVSAWNVQPRHKTYLQERLPGWSVIVCESAEEMAARLREDGGATVAVGWRFEQEWLDAAKDLRVLATPAAGADYFSVRTGAQVRTLNGGFHGELMAETALGLLLGHARGLFLGGRLMREGATWPRSEIDRMARPLRGSHLAIVGFGRIGGWIARLAKPFGVRLTGFRRTPGNERPSYLSAEDRVLPMEELDGTLPEVEHLMLVLPATPQTDRLLDRRRMALLPKHAAVYNLGRGNAIDEPALLDALRERRIAGAYLDVFAQEPLPADSPLRGLDNVWLLPHASAIAPNYLDLFFAELVPQLLAMR